MFRNDNREAAEPPGTGQLPAGGWLLQPSLSGTGSAPPAAPYSSTTSFACAFLAGPLGVLAIGALNVHRCRRWRKDAVFLALLVIATLAWLFVLPMWEGYAAMQAASVQALGPGAWRYANRAFALALFGLLHWRHRELDRAASLMGLHRPNGWIAGIAVILVANALPFAIAYVLTMSSQSS
jgi:hypothetical protein